MKLLPALLAAVTATEKGLEPLQAIAFAHSRVRNGFTLPVMDEITASNERLLGEVFSEDFATRLFSLDEMVSRSDNITESFMKQGPCDSSFPTLDGSCNHPEGAGRSMQPYKRLVPADYCDGKQSPRCGQRNKARLPSERTVSLAMKKTGAVKQNPTASFAFTAWGQFITHDIIQTPDVGGGKVPCTCGSHPSCKNIQIDRSKEPVLEFPCMFIIRSSSKLGQQDGVPVREQINQLSSFIDGTTIYGFTTKHKNLLVAADKMHLKMNPHKNGDFLPTVNDIKDKGVNDKFSTAAVFNDKGHPEFVAGDTRVLENPVLSSFHTLFARLHNKAVDEMLVQNPEWRSTPVRVFEEARLFVMSVIKQITYREHLPVLLGQQNMNLFPAMRVSRAHKRPRNTRFAKLPSADEFAQRAGGFSAPSQDDPSIRQEFVVAAYRFGHAMIPETLQSTDGPLQRNVKADLKDNYFDPDMVFKNGPGGCLRGAMMGETNMVSGTYSDSTQNNLFKPNNFKHGVDLLAINLARGREHGVGTYQSVKNFCMNHANYRKLYKGPPKMLPGWQTLVRLYPTPLDVDLYVGVLMEAHMPNAQVGPTAGCIIADQFLALKKGDRFWHENAGVFSDGQLSEVKNIGLAKVMCEVLEGMKRASQNPFIKANARVDGALNGIQNCDKIGKLDFSAWNTRAAPAATKAPVEEELGPGAGPTPKPVVDTKPDPEHSTIGCRLVGGRRNGIVQCGRAGNWEDGDMAMLAAHLTSKNGMPIVGKRQTMVQLPLNKVRRLDISGNPGMSSAEELKAVIRQLTGLLELNLSNTGISGVGVDTISNNPSLGHISMVGSGGECFDLDLFLKLSENLKRANKFIFFD